MKMIGKMEDGRVLAVLSLPEWNILTVIETELEVRQPTQELIPPAASEATRIHRGADCPDRASRIGATTPKTKTGKIICRTCKKPFKRANNSRRRDCSDKCLAEFKREYARQNYLKRHGKTTARPDRASRIGAAATTPPNPSDPFLTDEQRQELMARREKLIAESARRHADD